MTMRKTIQYAIDKYDGHVISRVGSAVAMPILQYKKMTMANLFAKTYRLEKVNVLSLSQVWEDYKWTRKIPLKIKNIHRKFWNMPPLKQKTKLT